MLIKKHANLLKCESHQDVIQCDQQQHRYILSFDR